jgi:uncharacterized protein (TIGR02246 family)
MSSSNPFSRLKVAAARVRRPAMGLIAAGILATNVGHAETLSAPDEAAISATVRAVPEALNHKDMKAYAELFDDDADWINVVGDALARQGQRRESPHNLPEDIVQQRRHDTAAMSIRAVTPDVAIAVVTENDQGGTLPDGSAAPPGSGRLTYVLVKRNGKWKIVHGHNTGINVAAQRFDPINAAGKAQGPSATGSHSDAATH